MIWIIIALYLLFVVAVGLRLKKNTECPYGHKGKTGVYDCALCDPQSYVDCCKRQQEAWLRFIADAERGE